MEQFSDKKPKILSPAGSPDALKAAVYAGADAVYLGLDKFNARMKADNFNTQNLAEWVDFCHLFGVKVYVTLNTSIKNEEFSQAVNLGLFCYSKNVDGLIVTDIGLLNFFAKFLPDFDVTLSTQQNIHNVAGAKIAKELGCKRIVLSRETPLVDMEKIKQSVQLEIESFLHGALCVSISGQCLFSSFIDGNSGNRGLCAQPCRQKYTSFLEEKQLKSGYLLSARDLCLARNLPKLSYAGIDMLKIEGRNRRPQYVAQSTQTYRNIINNDFYVSDSDLISLKTIYNRGDYTNGYLTNNSNIIYPHAQGHIGIQVGELIKKNNDWYVKGNVFLHDGDAFKIFRNNEEVGNALCISSSQNGVAKLSIKGNCKVGDKVNVTTSVAQIAKLDATTKTLSVSAKFIGKVGQQATLTLFFNNLNISAKNDIILQKAQKHPITEEDIVKQLSKTGNTLFTISDIQCEIDETFIPVSILNSLRRDALKMLYSAIIINYNKSLNRSPITKDNFDIDIILKKFCEQDYQSKQIDKKICIYTNKLPDQNIEYTDDTIVVFKPDDYNFSLLSQIETIATKMHVFLDLPNFATEADYAVLKSMLKNKFFEGVVVNNLYGIYLAREFNLKIILGLGMNLYNQYSLSTIASFCGESYYSFIYSQELTLNEISQFKDKSGFIFSDGEICLMTFAHCPLHVNLKCDCGKCAYQDKKLTYVDKTNRRFLLKRKRIAKCYWELYNCLPLMGADKINFSANYLIKPNEERRKEIYKFYKQKVLDPTTEEPNRISHTSGHLSKKVK